MRMQHHTEEQSSGEEAQMYIRVPRGIKRWEVPRLCEENLHPWVA